MISLSPKRCHCILACNVCKMQAKTCPVHVVFMEINLSTHDRLSCSSLPPRLCY